MNVFVTDKLLSQATVYQQQGHLAQAEKLYRQILADDPQYAPALHFLGLVLHQRGQIEIGYRYMHQALEISPANPVFLANLIHALMAQGKFRETLPLFQRLLDLNPSNASAWHELGTALRELGGQEDAVNCWQRALSVDPGYQPASCALGATLRVMALRDEAEAVYRNGLVQTPRDPVLICALAELQIESGRAKDALTMLNAIEPAGENAPNVLYYRGVAQIALGHFNEAETLLRDVIIRDPAYYLAHVQLTGISTVSTADPIYDRLETQAHEDTHETAEQRVNIHFSLGKILQDAGQYDHAFEHFTAGNRTCRTLRPYSHQKFAQQAADLKSRINKNFIEAMRPSGNPTDLPIFIVGMPRSGTTLVEQILARHPSVASGGEMMLVHGIVRRQLRQRFGQDLAAGLAGFERNAFVDIATQIESGLRKAAGAAARITDKMPSNFLMAGWLHALLPNARIIHCRRDPLDTCVSCYTTLFNYSHEFSNDLEDLGRYYRLYQEIMAHWQELLPANRLFELGYESLVSDPEPVVHGLLDFVELPWDRNCLEFGQTSTTVHTASVRQVRQALYGSSVGRWKQYSQHLAPLREALGEAD
jgi:tetratricopeptide (TPR) repeat protein